MLQPVLSPNFNELPSAFSERLGRHYADLEKAERKKEKGQFFTPVSIAQFMAGMVSGSVLSPSVQILDPGCGMGVLSAALVEQLVNYYEIKKIDLIAYETDASVLPFAKLVYQYIEKWLKEKGIGFTFQIREEDFVLANASVLETSNPGLFDVFSYQGPYFDLIITNPPYFKLSKDDPRVLSAPGLVSGHPNIYALFLGIAAKLLKQGGELVSITPRSFASGQYFKAFRSVFFHTIQLEAVHLFQSRKETFDKDSVLQETVVMKVKGKPIEANGQILLSSSHALRDLAHPSKKYVPISDLLDLRSSEKILHLPVSDEEDRILELVSSWKYTLKDFQIQVSTGPVVAFRAEAYIHQTYSNGTIELVPLIWMHHVSKMKLEWPKPFKEKGEYIRVEPGSHSLLLPCKDYILLRRFSTKDDKSRLIAAPFLAENFKFNFIGVENKVNYLYRKGGKLNREELIGLCALLNSHLFNAYFQMFNGNVNVSASELREMKFPPLEEIMALGKDLLIEDNYGMDRIDEKVKERFETKNTIDV